jgi:dihydroorotate dehydrogenase (fumarate)
MTDMTTSYLGLALKNPLVGSPAPLWKNVDNIKRFEDAGGAAVVLNSLFEEQIELESAHMHQSVYNPAESYGEALSYFPDLPTDALGPEVHLRQVEHAKVAVDIPIIASLNGATPGGWISYAKMFEEAGADALELNVYNLPSDPEVSGAEVEQQYVTLVKEISESIKIPVAVKIGPYFSSVCHFARQLEVAGAKGLVIFNRFCQPDLDLEALDVVPDLQLSTSNELRLRLRWAAILYGRVGLDMAVTGGVHTGEDLIKCMMSGASVAMTTSSLLREGIKHASSILHDAERWMVDNEYESIEMMQGSMSQQCVGDPTQYERANYIHVLGSWEQKKHMAS